MIAALEKAGAPPEVIAHVRARAESQVARDDFEVWPENLATLEAFIELQTSWDWITPGMGTPVRAGLRSTEIESTLRMLGVRGSRRTEVFQDLRAMERAALEVLRAT